MSIVKTTPPKFLPPLSRRCRPVCSGGCLPGQCKNATCPFHMHGQIMLGRPEVEAQKEHKVLHRLNQKKDQKQQKLFEFLNRERRIVGMDEVDEKNHFAGTKCTKAFREANSLKSPPLDNLETPEGPKTMRGPARPLCMLDSAPFNVPMNDYAELSRFLRISTMPGYSDNDTVSEYKDNHNMAVWNNKKDLDRQIYKFKKDWLSTWGESNVKEQRWRKAWVEKFGGEAFSK